MATKKVERRKPTKALRLTKEKPLSNRQLIRNMIDAEGEEAARKLGKKLRMNAGTVDAYIKGWARIRGGGATPVRGRKEGPANEEPWFRFPSKEKAAAERERLNKGNHTLPGVYDLKENEGRWALVVNKGFIAKHGAFTKTGLANLRRSGFEVADGRIRPIRRKAA